MPGISQRCGGHFDGNGESNASTYLSRVSTSGHTAQCDSRHGALVNDEEYTKCARCVEVWTACTQHR